jgi:hypothetical protein
MACRRCSSNNQKEFSSEINIHFPGRSGLEMPSVFIFPQLVVCLDCGFTECSVPKSELQRLASGGGASRRAETA